MKKENLKEPVVLFLGLGLVISIFYITGIGCPIKWLTGISCAGCGLTRACLCALQFKFAEAFSYHPLFWMVPIAVILFLLKNKIPKKILNGIIGIAIAVFLIVYIIRMVNPEDEIVVFHISDSIIMRIIRVRNYII